MISNFAGGSAYYELTKEQTDNIIKTIICSVTSKQVERSMLVPSLKLNFSESC